MLYVSVSSKSGKWRCVYGCVHVFQPSLLRSGCINPRPCAHGLADPWQLCGRQLTLGDHVVASRSSVIMWSSACCFPQRPPDALPIVGPTLIGRFTARTLSQVIPCLRDAHPLVTAGGQRFSRGV